MEQDIIAACKAEMFKRFPRDRIVIGRPASLSQYDKSYTVYGLIVQRLSEDGSPPDYEEDVKAALIAASGAWFDTLRAQGSVLVVRRALEYSTEVKPHEFGGFTHRCKMTVRAHAANEIKEFAMEGDWSPAVDYVDIMIKALDLG